MWALTPQQRGEGLWSSFASLCVSLPSPEEKKASSLCLKSEKSSHHHLCQQPSDAPPPHIHIQTPLGMEVKSLHVFKALGEV